MTLASDDADKVNKICATFNFADLDDIKTFLYPMYYNSSNGKGELMNDTGMNSTELDNLYNTSISGSFGA